MREHPHQSLSCETHHVLHKHTQWTLSHRQSTSISILLMFYKLNSWHEPCWLTGGHSCPQVCHSYFTVGYPLLLALQTELGCLKVWLAVNQQDQTYLLFQGHDCVYSEVSTLTGVSDSHRAREKQTSSQHLQAASSKAQTQSNTKLRDTVPSTATVSQSNLSGNQPVGCIQGQGLPGGVVHHCRVALEQRGQRPITYQYNTCTVFYVA